MANCWICGEPGAVATRTLLGFKRPVCPPGQGLCGRRGTPAPWPEGVVARYLTAAGATVDLTRSDTTGVDYMDGGTCSGCGHLINWGRIERVRQQAQKHAETCRALPRTTPAA